MRRNDIHHGKLIRSARYAPKKPGRYICGTIAIDLPKTGGEIIGGITQHADIHARCEVGHYLIRVRALPICVDLACFKRLSTIFEGMVDWREVIELNTQYAINGVNVLHHAAAFGTDGHPFANHVPNQTQRAVFADNKEHRTRVGRRNVPDRNFVRKRRIAAISTSDPVRCHEAEINQSFIKAPGVLDTGLPGIKDIRRGPVIAVEQCRNRRALRSERAVCLGRSETDSPVAGHSSALSFLSSCISDNIPFNSAPCTKIASTR